MPESPRWLAVQGKYEELKELLNKICKINGRKMPEDFNPESLLEEVTGRQLFTSFATYNIMINLYVTRQKVTTACTGCGYKKHPLQKSHYFQNKLIFFGEIFRGYS